MTKALRAVSETLTTIYGIDIMVTHEFACEKSPEAIAFIRSRVKSPFIFTDVADLAQPMARDALTGLRIPSSAPSCVWAHCTRVQNPLVKRNECRLSTESHPNLEWYEAACDDVLMTCTDVR